MLVKWISYMQKNKTRPLSYLYTKINSERIKALNIRLDTMSFLEENIRSRLLETVLAVFSWICLQRQGQQKQKINKMDSIKLKSFCAANEVLINTKGNPLSGKMDLQPYILQGANIQNVPKNQ